ncbi:MAG TPA: MucB/RseB C-terminal domain-containing protein [Cellvibrionaceae bacterium]
MLWWQAALVLTLSLATVATQGQQSSSAVSDDVVSSSADALPSVHELLNTMSQQQQALNYEGALTYQNSTGAESFKLQHWVDEGVEYQRLYYLTGPEREAVLVQHTDCKAPGSRLLHERLQLLQQNIASLDALYTLRVRGLERVAGRVAVVLQVTPRDTHRFGYFLSVDRDTGLLLKSVLFDEQLRVLEQFQFIELNIATDVASFAERADAAISYKIDGNQVAGCVFSETETTANWSLGWLPEGFELVGRQQLRDNMDMLMYTDGLSSFSLFLDPVVGQLVIEGHAQRGATNFYMSGLKVPSGSFQLTIIGEIPVPVAERIAQSVQSLQGPVPAASAPGS